MNRDEELASNLLLNGLRGASPTEAHTILSKALQSVRAESEKEIEKLKHNRNIYLQATMDKEKTIDELKSKCAEFEREKAELIESGNMMKRSHVYTSGVSSEYAIKQWEETLNKLELGGK